MPKVLETNIVKKDHRKVRTKVAICYPGPYRVGMSCLAIHLIYDMLNSIKDVACERAFFPSDPTAEVNTLESSMPLNKMDIIGFSLQYETDFINVLRMLINSSIPLRSKNRKDEDPLVIAGGPCATGNPEPLSDFVDLFVVGDAEPVLPRLIDLIAETRRPRAHLDEFLDVEGLYIPSLNQGSVERVWVKDLSAASHPIKQIIPHVTGKRELSPVFGETFLVDATRGCGHGCRFCYVGYIGRPYRERTKSRLEEIIEEGTKQTGVDKVSLVGSGLSDHSHLVDVCHRIVGDAGLKLSLSSLRADSTSIELLRILADGGERTLTIAPETGSQSLRDSLNKKITNDDIIQAAENALEAGLRNVKLYFMIGLPGEKDEDIQGILKLVKRIGKIGFQSRSIRLSIAPFVPKPHTPFQWFPFAPQSELDAKLGMIRSSLGADAKVDVESLDLRWAKVQAILSMADRRAGEVLEYVARAGGTLGAWRRAISEYGNMASFFESWKASESVLPWDKIHVGVNKEFLKTEMKKALIGEKSPSCLTVCSECGAC
nr:radical SAM protein [Candidatus Njordarchaeum guaymaensis]